MISPARRALPLAALAVVAAFGVWTVAGSGAGSGKAAFAFQPLVSGLNSPVYVTSAPGDPSTLYVVEQAGTIRIVRGARVAGTFLDIRNRVAAGGERGLLSLAFHPDYRRNHLFYVYYTDVHGDSHVEEYRSAGGVGVSSSARRILFVHQPYSNHNGGQLQFDGHGYLYVGFGDGGSEGDPDERPQNLRSRLGKLLRIDPTRRGSAWQMVGLGLRNPWRFSFDRKTGDLWIGDVGQDRWEEIDRRAAQRVGRLANYGWSRYEGKTVYDASKPLTRRGTLVFPVAVYSHSRGCSVTGGYVYRGSALPSARGRYFFGDYCSGTIWTLPAGGGSATAIPGTIEQLSSFGQDGNGELYATSLAGTVYALR